MSVRTDRLAGRLVEALEHRRAMEEAAGHAVAWPPPPAPGWAHLPIVLIDLIYNLGRNYDLVARPAIRNYAEHAVEEMPYLGSRGSLTAPFAATRNKNHRPHTLGEALSLLAPMTTAQRTQLFGVGNLPAYRRANAPRRADTVVTVTENVLALGITTAEQLRAAIDNDPEQVRKAIQRKTPGIGAAGWAYLPLLVDHESVKRDVHVDRFVRGNLGERLNDAEIKQVFERAAELIEERTGDQCTVRGIEHFVWRAQSNRRLREAS